MPTLTIPNNAATWPLSQFNTSSFPRTPPVVLHHSLHNTRAFRIHCIPAEPLLPLEQPKLDQADVGGGGGDGHGGDGGGNGGDGGGGGGGGDDEEFGPLLNFEAVMRESEARGVKLPSDMVEAARTIGIREMFLLRYLELQVGFVLATVLSDAALFHAEKSNARRPFFSFQSWNRGLIVIDSCCATFAEVQKRGKDFWAEFELYAADLLVGVVVDIALVGLLAPYARIGTPSRAKGLLGQIQHVCAALPSSVFEAQRPGCKFSAMQRVATFFYKGALYGSVGFGCGIIGQGIANAIMNAKRSIKKSEHDIPVPPLLQSAALWGFFLAVSSNARYQIINGLESLVEASPVAKRVPLVAMAFTVGVRFGNNIYGGMQFVDWAKSSGVHFYPKLARQFLSRRKKDLSQIKK
ncbi:Protein RETICULATA-RELATED 1, chloroplastic, partial [Mucuna pruriens]